ncbi:MAG: VOC family protein [Steroidobacteraceae bacterium]|jgi:predicted enzyme related to lactoylglutathione lyase
MKLTLLRARRLRVREVLAACLCLGASSMIMAALAPMPPISDAVSIEHHPGKVIWADLVTPDLAVVEPFYSGVFGWTFRVARDGDIDYVLALSGGRPVAGLFRRPMPAGTPQQPIWVSFIATNNFDSARRTALAHGATVLNGPGNVGGRGRQMILRDPEGAIFGIMASSSGDPPDYLAEPGEWIWSSLLASDAGKDAAFYQEVFGYEVYELASDDNAEHLILSGDDFARASVHTLPVDQSRRHSHWIYFVRVLSTVQASASAAALGGRVLVEPHADRHGNMVAVVADPTGAPVGLMEWSDSSDVGAAK